MSRWRVRFWGTRGSCPAPGARTQRYGGNTSCVEARWGDSLLILDAGTGIRELGDRLVADSRGRPIEGDLFITHTHWDHIQGFPFFVPAYARGNRFRVHGAHGVGRSFETVFKGLMDPSYFPVDLGGMSAVIEFHEVTGEPFACGEVTVRSTFTNHPGVNLAYRLEAGGRSLTYLTDHETYQAMNQPTEFARKQDKIIEDFCRGSDLLVCDAQYTEDEYRVKRTWGHSRFTDSLRLALNAGVRRVALFHHDPGHSDEQIDAMGRECAELARRSGGGLEFFFARDGQELEF